MTRAMPPPGRAGWRGSEPGIIHPGLPGWRALFQPAQSSPAWVLAHRASGGVAPRTPAQSCTPVLGDILEPVLEDERVGNFYRTCVAQLASGSRKTSLIGRQQHAFQVRAGRQNHMVD